MSIDSSHADAKIGPRPLRLLIYDRTCRGKKALPGLSHAWQAGSWLYAGLRRLDGAHGAASWAEALEWLATFRPERPLAEIQYWGHGKWGGARIANEVLDRSALLPEHPLGERLRAIRARLVPTGEALWWFRTCETFGAVAGQDFARAWTEFFGCRAAGHTHIIGFHQSGLHLLAPGQSPSWAADEGIARGTPQEPLEALRSSRSAPNTITCLQGRIPKGY
jgi:hypothetical protein